MCIIEFPWINTEKIQEKHWITYLCILRLGNQIKMIIEKKNRYKQIFQFHQENVSIKENLNNDDSYKILMKKVSMDFFGCSLVFSFRPGGVRKQFHPGGFPLSDS